jgi:hypothetical protein
MTHGPRHSHKAKNADRPQVKVRTEIPSAKPLVRTLQNRFDFLHLELSQECVHLAKASSYLSTIKAENRTQPKHQISIKSPKWYVLSDEEPVKIASGGYHHLTASHEQHPHFTAAFQHLEAHIHLCRFSPSIFSTQHLKLRPASTSSR